MGRGRDSGSFHDSGGDGNWSGKEYQHQGSFKLHGVGIGLFYDRTVLGHGEVHLPEAVEPGVTFLCRLRRKSIVACCFSAPMIG